MEYWELISRDFEIYLNKRSGLMILLAETSIANTNKSIYQEISGLLNRLYRNISEEYSGYMQKDKFNKILKGYKDLVIAPYKLDLASTKQ